LGLQQRGHAGVCVSHARTGPRLTAPCRRTGSCSRALSACAAAPPAAPPPPCRPATVFGAIVIGMCKCSAGLESLLDGPRTSIRSASSAASRSCLPFSLRARAALRVFGHCCARVSLSSFSRLRSPSCVSERSVTCSDAQRGSAGLHRDTWGPPARGPAPKPTCSRIFSSCDRVMYVAPPFSVMAPRATGDALGTPKELLPLLSARDSASLLLLCSQPGSSRLRHFCLSINL
jgi:hypothetical protein